MKIASVKLRRYVQKHGKLVKTCYVKPDIVIKIYHVDDSEISLVYDKKRTVILCC